MDKENGQGIEKNAFKTFQSVASRRDRVWAIVISLKFELKFSLLWSPSTSLNLRWSSNIRLRVWVQNSSSNFHSNSYSSQSSNKGWVYIEVRVRLQVSVIIIVFSSRCTVVRILG